MSIVLNTESRSPSQALRNPSVALCDLFVLLNQAIRESVLTQGNAADDISKGIQTTADLLKTLNHNAAELRSKIEDHASTMKAIQPYMIALAVVGGIAGGAAGFLGGVAGIGAATVASLTGIAGGVTSVVEGSYNLQSANLSEQLAHQSGTLAKITGTQQNYQSTSKWMISQLGDAFTHMGQLAKSVSKGNREINEGISTAGKEAVNGTLGIR